MGETRLILRRSLIAEPKTDRLSLDLTPNSSPKRRGECAVLLDNIRSAWNVGSILRSADGFGFAHAYLCGITPTPENEAVSKTALGAEDTVTWSLHKDAVKLIKGLKKEGWKVKALEDDRRSVSIKDEGARTKVDPEAENRVVLIVGNEATGVDPGLLDLCDQIYHIPMRGEKKSFNVAIAFSVAAFQMQK